MIYAGVIPTITLIILTLIAVTESSSCVYNSGPDNGYIFSPNYPSTYSSNQACSVIFTVDEGDLIRLTFHGAFHMELEATCVYDHVKVTDLDPATNAVIRSQMFCGDQRPAPYLSKTSKIKVEFKSDGSNEYSGFSAVWTKVANPNKYNFVESESGVLTYPEDEDVLDWKWSISAPLGKFLSLRFTSTFDLGVKDAHTCDGDVIEIFDAMGNGSLVSRGSWCGMDRPPALTSFGSNIVITLRRSGKVNGQTFSAEWLAVSDCGGVFTTAQGHIMSYDYPNDRRPSDVISALQNCTWDILLEEPYHVVLSFHHAMNENNCRNIQVLDYSESDNEFLPRQDWCVPNVIGQDVTSSGSKLRLVYEQGENAGQGLFVSWTTACGQTLSATTGNLSSPGYEIEYPPSLNCEWVIEGVEDHTVRLDFRSPFDIETSNDYSCGYDYLEVFDSMAGGDLVSHGRFCGTQPPLQLISSSKTMVVRFHSDENKQGKGFSVSWEVACGDVYTALQGNVTTPRFPSPYPHNFDCRWEIRAPEGYVINLAFNEPFSLEDAITCDADYLEVYDYTQNGSLSKKGRWCGQDAPPLQTSLTSRMVLVFHSDGTGSNMGFQAVWDSTKIEPKPCSYSMEGNSGAMTYPQDLELSPLTHDCTWNISVPLGKFIFLEFASTFGLGVEDNLACDGDEIQIFDVMGNDSLVSRGSWCGIDRPPALTSFGSKMVITLHRSMEGNGQRNFSAEWQAASDCGGVFTTTQGHIMSYDYPNDRRPNDVISALQNCTWDILVEELYHVVLSFHHSMDELDCQDLQILDYSETNDEFFPRQNWCVPETDDKNVTSLGHVKSSSHIMRLVYRQGEIVGRGLFVSWTSECGQTLTAMKGNLSSPRYGIEYPPNLNCEWVIEGKEDRSIRLDFRPPFDIETSNDYRCDYDYVEVFDSMPGGDLVSHGRFCGTQPPKQLISSSQSMVVRFHSDKSKQGKGFSASWDTSCGDVYTALQGNVTTPRFSSPYPHNFDCRWEIQAPEGYVINLAFKKQFSLEGNSRCDADYLEVYDYSQNGSLSKRGRWCGQDAPPLQTSVTSRMVLVFHSDGAKNENGFQAKWESVKSEKCGRELHGPSGTFTSPGFPQPYPADLRCRWGIHVTRGQRVKLDFGEAFDLEMDGDDCSYDGVEVFDSLSNGTLISQGKWCSARKLPAFYSTSSLLVVSFYSDSNKNGRGFSASWESVSGCGEISTKRAGHLLSPNFPSNYPEYQECRWEIRPPTKEGVENVTLHFDPQFELEVGDDCAWDYVEIHRDGDVLGRWCGTSAPPDVISGGQTLVVIFKSDKSVTGRGFFASWG